MSRPCYSPVVHTSTECEYFFHLGVFCFHTDRFPRAPPPRRCPLVSCARIPPRAAAGLPAADLTNSCCWEFRNPPGHCHNSRRHEAGWRPRRSPVGGSPAGEKIRAHKHNMGLIIRDFQIRDPKSGRLGGWGRVRKDILRLTHRVRLDYQLSR